VRAHRGDARPRALERTVDCLGGGVEQLGDLARLPAQHVAQDQDGSLARREDAAHEEERAPDVVGGRGEVGGVVGPEGLGTVLERAGPGLEVDRHRVAPAPIARVDADVRRDPVQPRPQRRPTLEAVDVRPTPDERVLDSVLGIGGRAEHARAVPLQLATVRFERPGQGTVERARHARFFQRDRHADICNKHNRQAARRDRVRIVRAPSRTPSAGPTVGGMIRPKVQYAHADDGVTIAYSVFGEGPVTMVLISPLISQVEVAWEEPSFEHFMSCLGAGARVVMYDRRGTGLSDHTTASGERLSLPQLARDVHAVLDASGTDAAVLVGVSMGGMTAVQFAVDFPERTQAIVLVGSTAKITRVGDLDLHNPSDIDAWADSAARHWGSGAALDLDGPSERDATRYREWAGRLERHTCSPGMLAASLRWAASYDIRPLLGHVRAKTLVVHRSGDRLQRVENGRFLAEHIPGARFAELSGHEHTFFLGDQQEMLDIVFEFIDEHVAGGALRSGLRRAERRNAYGVGWDSLTPSEREVAVLVASGLTNAEVAERLRMSRFTVDGRLRRIFAKLDVTSRVELTAEYARIAG
jgi:pimeloyl-ACP methyl ester carboxylesterase/DNA-binding CsgD family transcriptional regulator